MLFIFNEPIYILAIYWFIPNISCHNHYHLACDDNLTADDEDRPHHNPLIFLRISSTRNKTILKFSTFSSPHDDADTIVTFAQGVCAILASYPPPGPELQKYILGYEIFLKVKILANYLIRKS